VRPFIALACALTFVVGMVACGGDDSSSTGTSAPASTTTTTAAPRPVCGNPGPPPHRYESVVVFSFENRTWSQVGPRFGPQMPYLHRLGKRCTAFADWTETDPAQSSLTQYVGQVTGARQPLTQNDCSPSVSCSTVADNLFRQAREAGLRAVNFVEGATKPCDATGNAVRHVPAMYMWGADDRAHCAEQVRPYSEFDVDELPAFAFVTPTTCNDGHDCDNAKVDAWAKANIGPVLRSAAYRAGKVAVFVWYDEDHPVPNLWIAPNARAQFSPLPGAGYAGTLAAWE
jgi:acid phosphatase